MRVLHCHYASGPDEDHEKVRTADVSVALVWGLIVAIAGYAVVRVVQHLLFPEPDPAALVWSAHAGFFWRVWTVAYAGGMAAFAVFVAPHRTGLAARALAPGIAVAASLLVLQTIFFP